MGPVRSRGRKRGAEPLTAQREAFVRLIARGVSNAEACRVVGVHRRTGTRWRLGRTVISSSGSALRRPRVDLAPVPRPAGDPTLRARPG
ncbi:helix-turn-helix domain-containing protein [Pengzhenrongella frigida]|uniref:helix-turn-helix domain-containing protein n=1 Tax=Pengzhenrongella frigida TaxID=1259133 RepID=UPI003312F904